VDDNAHLYAGFLILCLVFLAIGYHLNQTASALRMPSNPDFRNPLTGYNFYNLDAGNYTFSLEIKNPWENLSIRVYSFIFTEPKPLQNFVDFTVSVQNGTLLNPYETVEATVTISVTENNFTENEVYLRIGSYRAGIDY